MASSMQAAVYMEPSYEKILEFFKNSEASKVCSVFTRMIIDGNSEIKNVLTADVASSLWEKPYCLKKKQ